MTVRDWENSRAYSIMCNLNPTFWIDSSMMLEQEKQNFPTHETTGGYLKSISLKEAWVNLWGNLSESDKQVFKDLENFDAAIFKEITSIKV